LQADSGGITATSVGANLIADGTGGRGRGKGKKKGKPRKPVAVEDRGIDVAEVDRILKEYEGLAGLEQMEAISLRKQEEDRLIDELFTRLEDVMTSLRTDSWEAEMVLDGLVANHCADKSSDDVQDRFIQAANAMQRLQDGEFKAQVVKAIVSARRVLQDVEKAHTSADLLVISNGKTLMIQKETRRRGSGSDGGSDAGKGEGKGEGRANGRAFGANLLRHPTHVYFDDSFIRRVLALDYCGRVFDDIALGAKASVRLGKFMVVWEEVHAFKGASNSDIASGKVVLDVPANLLEASRTSTGLMRIRSFTTCLFPKILPPNEKKMYRHIYMRELESWWSRNASTPAASRSQWYGKVFVMAVLDKLDYADAILNPAQFLYDMMTFPWPTSPCDTYGRASRMFFKGKLHVEVPLLTATGKEKLFRDVKDESAATIIRVMEFTMTLLAVQQQVSASILGKVRGKKVVRDFPDLSEELLLDLSKDNPFERVRKLGRQGKI
jgi:hypothetical protein